jgi:glycosyltransferase involved in cell wall biosynthesis
VQYTGKYGIDNMKFIRLGIINSSPFDISYGGVGPFIKNLDPFLQQYFEIHYITLSEKFLEINIIPRRLLFIVYLMAQRRLFKECDIILSHVPEGSYIVSFTNIPFIHIFHGNFNPMSQSRYWYGKYFKFVFELFEKRIIEKAVLKYTVGVERPGIPKIFNPIYHSVEVKEHSNRKGLIFAGRLEKIKNVDRIIRIYGQLPESIRREHPLYIAGFGTQEEPLKQLAKDMHLQNVIFLGHLSNEDLIEAVSRKRIFVMASSQEGLPMAIAEALSVGLPVISTDTGDISRIIETRYNGYLVPLEFNDSSYCESIMNILDNYETFANNALLSSHMFDAENVAMALIKDINDALSRS